MKREVLRTGKWLPLAKRVRFTCCRCGLKHVHRYRVKRGGKLELLVEHPLGRFP